MFKKLFGFAGTLKDIITAGKALMSMADRADDDLDNDGKAEYVNILEELEDLEKECLVCCREMYSKFMRIVERGKKLAAHVAGGDNG